MMKNITYLLLAIALISCQQEQQPKEYAVIYGTIKNPSVDLNLRLYDPIASESFMVEVAPDGTFRDTLRLADPVMFNAVYENMFNLYLENDMDLEVTFNKNELTKSIAFAGDGAAENQFLLFKNKNNAELMGADYKEYLGLEDEVFERKTEDYIAIVKKELNDNNDTFSQIFIDRQLEALDDFKESITAQHVEQLTINENLSPGKPSPTFENYLNYDGGTNDLNDYLGKYIYIDVWATWCVPCVYEMPYMNKIEKEYANKNIQFIGLSIDDPERDEQSWRDMIVDKELHGTQLLADDQINSQFIRDYYIYGIPRFILLDPQGNIVSYDAPRPSEPRLKELFNSLNI